MGNVYTINELEKLRVTDERKWGLTGGYYDLLHEGHMKHFERCKGMCDVLIVHINTDKDSKKLKNKIPIIPEVYRALLVAKEPSVDYSFIHPYSTYSSEIVKRMNPDLLIISNEKKNHIDNKIKYLEEMDRTEVVFVPRALETVSSTSIREDMRKLNSELYDRLGKRIC